MVIDQATLARRLKEARDVAGVTQEQAATTLEVPRTAIAQIEAAKRSVSSLELAKLAGLYGKDFAEFFREGPTNEDPIVVLHRLAPGLEEDPEVRSQVELCLTLCQQGKELESILGRDSGVGPPAYTLPIPRGAGEAVKQAAVVAEQERQRLGLGDAPIADVADLLNCQGVWATGVNLPDHMSGLFLKHATTGMVVLTNITHSETRKRFSYAHEYGHALLDRDKPGTVTSRENSSDLIEKRANAFAAAFLMPASGVDQFLQRLNKGSPSRVDQSVFDVATEGRIDTQLRTEPGSQTISYQDVVKMARWFKVSYKAAVYRLKSLDKISQAESDTLLADEGLAKSFREILSLGNDDEPTSEIAHKKPDGELVAQVIHLAVEAYRLGEISRGRLLEISDTVGVEGKTLLSLAEAARAE